MFVWQEKTVTENCFDRKDNEGYTNLKTDVESERML